MSDEDYENLLQIVEAEAGTEDLKGRILVANVIMNRVKYPEFPDNATDVIWQYIDFCQTTEYYSSLPQISG